MDSLTHSHIQNIHELPRHHMRRRLSPRQYSTLSCKELPDSPYRLPPSPSSIYAIFQTSQTRRPHKIKTRQTIVSFVVADLHKTVPLRASPARASSRDRFPLVPPRSGAPHVRKLGMGA